MSEWIEAELPESQMHDLRHAKRLARLLERFREQAVSSTPRACYGWAETMTTLVSKEKGKEEKSPLSP